MRMGFWQSICIPVPMHVKIGNHTLIHELRSREVAGERDALCLTHLARNGELYLPGQLRIFPNLDRLDGVPELFAVRPYVGRVLRQQHFGMHDATLGRKVMGAVQPLVAQPRRRAISSRGHRAGTGGAADDLHVEMIDRHDGAMIYTGTPTSERRISAPSLNKISGAISTGRTVLATLKPSARCLVIIAASTVYGGCNAQTTGL